MNKVIAIDGPSGSGKGTIAKILSERCNLLYIDTGATYRALTYGILKNNIDINSEEEIISYLKNIKITFDKSSKTYLNNEDISFYIRTNDVSDNVSIVSKYPKVREYMVSMQREMSKNEDCIMEGRDITTVVLKDANYKFYLDASVESRVERRLLQNKNLNIESTYEDIKRNIEERDYNDMNRSVGALKRTSDQIYIDTTNLSIEEVVNIMLEKIGE